jgi:predicted DNA binding CopG/RHH family protein
MKHKLDDYEKEVLDSFERSELKPVKDLPAEKKRFQSYARVSLKKNKRVNIRIAEYDLKAIQVKAMEEGIPYQTMISSVLHKFVNGRLTHK